MTITTIPRAAARCSDPSPYRLRRFGVLLACAAALSLPACSPKPIDALATAPAAAASTAGADDPSVPPAESVMAPANRVPQDPSAGRSTGTLSNAQESSAMPMPGQNNDHSAPATLAKPASAP